jgi:hypothetical protein
MSNFELLRSEVFEPDLKGRGITEFRIVCHCAIFPPTHNTTVNVTMAFDLNPILKKKSTIEASVSGTIHSFGQPDRYLI